MAQTEWEREQNRREFHDREKENNKLLRQQTEAARRMEKAQLADQQHAALIREQELEAQQEAALHAARSASLAEQRLEEQREHNEAVADHNFTMWRQGTPNGAAYEAWLDEVQPLVTVADARDARWDGALDADFETEKMNHLRAGVRRSGQLSRKFALVHGSEGDEEPPSFFSYLKRTVIASLVGDALVLLVFFFLWVDQVFRDKPPALGPTLLSVFLIAVPAVCIGFEMVYRFPLARQYWKLSDGAFQWAMKEYNTNFHAHIPQTWQAPGDDDIKSQLAAARALIQWMPTGYHQFRTSMLTEVPARLPVAYTAEQIDARAVNIRKLAQEFSGELEATAG